MADLILYNGKVYAQDPAYAGASAVAVRDGRIFALGSDREMRDLARPGSAAINLEGQLVLPGLVDGHFHYTDWALAREQLPLAGAVSWRQIEAEVAVAAAARPAGAWIVGRGWNETYWADPSLPTRAGLDAVAGEHPALLYRSDMHLAVANSAALAAGHVTAETADPEGGVIDRDASGAPTGLLRDLAINLVSGAMPDEVEDETVAAMRRGIPYLHSLGLTGLHDFRVMGGTCGQRSFRGFARLQAEGCLDLRIWMHLPGERLEEAIALGLRTGFGSQRLRVGALKFFVDGSQGARTAWMLEPYEDGGTGIALQPLAGIMEATRRAEAAGLAVAIHAIGDRANRELIAALGAALAAGPQNDARRVSAPPAAPPRIEHVQMIRPEDIPAFARLGVVASVQPLQITDDIPMIEASVGERARYAYSFRGLADAGVTLALGSDAPVVDPNPLWGIHAAVTRCRRDGTPVGGWYPEQRLTVPQAIWGYTMGNAIASGREKELGSITPGKLGDFTVVDRDLLTVDPDELAEAKVTLTVFDGQAVYRR